MTIENPIHLVDFNRLDLSRKKGLNIPGEPLVPVTEEFREAIASELLALAERMDELNASDQYPAAVKVQLHAKSLAKSNRPYDLLNRVRLPVVAVERPGQLIVAATGPKLLALRSYVLALKDPRGQFDISTFVSFGLWDPATDVLHLGTSADAAALQSQVRENPTLMEISLFPWMTPSATLPDVALESLPRGSSADVPSLSEADDRASRERRDPSALESATVASNSFSSAISRAGFERPVRVNSRVVYAESTAETDVISLAGLLGVRRVRVAPTYAALDSTSVDDVVAIDADHIPAPSDDLPTVGVLDSGVSSASLEPWVVAHVNSDPAMYTDAFHGTFVAGLVIGSKALNGGDDRFPADRSLVLDGQLLPSTPINPLLLIERIRDIVTSHSSSIKVWNCSFALTQPLSPPEYSVIAQEMDQLSHELGVLFVQAAGNFSEWPNRAWPPQENSVLEDGISSPGEAIRSLTVGALSHLGGHVPIGAPTSYSRRGPSFAVQVKPEVTHWGGDVDNAGIVAGHGIKSVSTADTLIESIGTSFSTPLVSTIAANLWQQLELGSAVDEVRPELVKGLLAHSAALSMDAPTSEHRHYTGWGTPASSTEILTDTSSSFTTIHEVQLSPQTQWILAPFPVPGCLIVDGDKFAGEAILTISYDPPIRSEFGPECVRYEVEGGFGYTTTGDKGDSGLKSITVEDLAQTSFWEKDQIDDGKWSSLKTFRARHPKGRQGQGQWGLRLALLQRIQDEIGEAQKVYAILTLRSVGEPLDVYADGIRALADLRLGNRAMVRSDDLRLRP